MFMRKLLSTTGSRLLLAALVLIFACGVPGQSNRKIAVTIDDLPVVTIFNDIEVRRRITRDILDQIKDSQVPVVGFVNEGKLYRDGKLVDDEVDLLRQWTAAGLELGNHTYSHMSLNSNPVGDFISDVERGEIVTKQLLATRGMKLRYFRHPYLHTGLDVETKRTVAAYFEKNGYSVAPVTVDDADWIFARAYDKAEKDGDKDLRKRVGEAYVPYLELKLGYWEKQSKALLGREVAQTLLLHANSVNAEFLGDILDLLKKRGYECVSLDEVLRDEAYSQAETFTGKAGISWLHRWAIAKGKENILPEEPRVPEFVMKAAGVDSE